MGTSGDLEPVAQSQSSVGDLSPNPGLEKTSATEDERMKWDHGEYYDIAFGISRSRRYHSKMQDFYQRWADITSFVAAVLGTGAFLVLIGGKDTELAKILTGIVATASSLSFTFSPSKKAWVHTDLAKNFTQLYADLLNKDPSYENLRWAENKRLELEAKEFPVRRLVDLQADNEEARSRGVDEKDLIPLTKRQRIFGYIFTFGLEEVEQRLAARQADGSVVAPNRDTSVHPIII